jgi:inner membrane protein
VIGRTHIAIGLMTAAIIINPPDLKFAAVCAGVTAFSSILPDVDHPNGLLRRISGITPKPLNIIAYFLVLFWFIYKFQLSTVGVVVLTAATAVSLFMPHRSFTHSFLGLIVFSSGIYLTFKPFFLPFTIGYLMHLIADYFTKSGMQLYFPFGQNEKFGLVSTGSVEDDLIGMVSMIGFFIIAHIKMG